MKLKKRIKQIFCKHENKIILNKTQRLISVGMRKEITTSYCCPNCDRVWREVDIV